MNNKLMGIDAIPDWETRLARQDAFWRREILDRPVVAITLAKATEAPPANAKHWATFQARWFDPEYHTRQALTSVVNKQFLGDALPYVWPNLGPDLFAGFLGAQLEYTETTCWTKPLLTDLAGAAKLEFSEANCYWRKLMEITEALLDAGRHKFYTGFTDFHPGADALAALRGTAQLCLDLIESPDEVKQALKHVTDIYLEILDRLYAKLTAAGQAIGCNCFPMVSRKRWHMICIDFAYNISKPMYDEVFLPQLVRECRHLEASIYHLDGKAATRHLDSILGIKELSAMQYSPGPGIALADCLDTFNRFQDAGKALILSSYPDELDLVIQKLHPEGVWLEMYGVKNAAHAEEILRNISQWR